MGMGLMVDGMGTISKNLYCTSKKGTPLPQSYNNHLLYSFLPVLCFLFLQIRANPAHNKARTNYAFISRPCFEQIRYYKVNYHVLQKNTICKHFYLLQKGIVSHGQTAGNL